MMLLSRETGWDLPSLSEMPVSEIEGWTAILTEQKDIEREKQEEEIEKAKRRGADPR